jgi:hypothetical protein
MASETFGSTTIISDVGPTANSYISVADAKAYYDLDPNKDYSAITDENLAKALITSTLLADINFGDQYVGLLEDSDNALFWPRTGAVDERGVSITDYTVFPAQLGLAVAEQGYSVAQENRETEISISNVISQKLDGVGSQTFMSASDQKIAASKPLFVERFSALIKPFIIGGGSGYTTVLQRG